MKKYFFIFFALLPMYGYCAEYQYTDSSTRTGIYEPGVAPIPTESRYGSPLYYPIRDCGNENYTLVTERYITGVGWRVRNMGVGGSFEYEGLKCLSSSQYLELKAQQEQAKIDAENKLKEEETRKRIEEAKKSMVDGNGDWEKAKAEFDKSLQEKQLAQSNSIQETKKSRLEQIRERNKARIEALKAKRKTQ